MRITIHLLTIPRSLPRGILFFLAVLLLAFCLGASGQTNRANFDEPLDVKNKVIGKNELGQAITSVCYTYQNFAIIEVNDPNYMGASSLTVRPLRPSTNNQSVCQSRYQGAEYTVKLDGYYLGKFADYIYTEGPDCFGIYCPFQIFKLSRSSYSLVYSGNVGLDKEIKFYRTPQGSIGFYYWMGLADSANTLSTACSFAKKNQEKCWDKLLSTNSINTNLPVPDCSTIYKTKSIEFQDPSQILLQVQVFDVRSPNSKKIQSKHVICYPSP